MRTPRRRRGGLVIVGASLAGLRGAEAARRLGYAGPITLIGAEPHPPYDRPPLSKEFLGRDASTEATPLAGADQLVSALGVELLLGEPAASLDLSARAVDVGDQTVEYDNLLVATGATARVLPTPHPMLGVHALRTVDDARAVRAALDAGARTVVVGAGFIGSEVASSARKRGLPVTVLEAAPTPLVRSVGTHAGAALSLLHERNGTDLRCGTAVAGLIGDERVRAVALADGTEIPADLVVVGVGAAPETSWLQGSGLLLRDGLECDDRLRAAEHVYGAGDVASWLSPDFGKRLRLEHWTNAAEMAAHAVRNLLDVETATPYSHIPYFWSDWYEARIQFVGIATGIPQIVTGAWDGSAFVALYRDRDRLVGALALNRRGDIMKYRALIARGASWDDALQLAAARNAAVPLAV